MTKFSTMPTILPRTSIEVVVAHAALVGPRGEWFPIPIEQAPDGWGSRPLDTRWMRRVDEVGWLMLIHPRAFRKPATGRWSPVLFDTRVASTVVERSLVSATSRRPVWINYGGWLGLDGVLDYLESIAICGGALPPEWNWEPHCVINSPDGWLPRRLTAADIAGRVEAYVLPGFPTWSVESVPNRPNDFVVKRNGRVVRRGADGRSLRFSNRDDAKRYCEEQNQ